MPSLIPAFGSRYPLTVGLLGGSFNPAHHGHVHISLAAKRALKLDQVWWLVSPQNPLKSKTDMAPIKDRLQSAHQLVRHGAIRISDVESKLGTQYTADTLCALQKRYPHIRFIWLMGSDNLASFHLWKDWQKIAKRLSICILHRPGYSLRALSSKTACRFASDRLSTGQASVLKYKKAPKWVFLPIRGMSISSTHIRRQLKDQNHRTF